MDDIETHVSEEVAEEMGSDIDIDLMSVRDKCEAEAVAEACDKALFANVLPGLSAEASSISKVCATDVARPSTGSDPLVSVSASALTYSSSKKITSGGSSTPALVSKVSTQRMISEGLVENSNPATISDVQQTIRSLVIPLTGRLPQPVISCLNKAWQAAGHQTPSEFKISELAQRFGLSDAARFRKFFKGKRDRDQRKRCRGEANSDGIEFGSALANRLEAQIFYVAADHVCHPLVTESLYYVSHIERMGSMLDVGVKVVRALNTETGERLVLNLKRSFKHSPSPTVTFVECSVGLKVHVDAFKAWSWVSCAGDPRHST